MWQEDIMVPEQKYSIIRPRVYELQICFWNWCKLSEVCELVPSIAARAGVEYSPSPEELVWHFAALVKPNRVPFRLDPKTQQPKKAKIFRYSVTGAELRGTEVPTENPRPPYSEFVLDIGTPHPSDIFVPEGWVIDVMKAVRLGAIAAITHGEEGSDLGVKNFALFPKDSGKDSIALDGSGHTTSATYPW